MSRNRTGHGDEDGQPEVALYSLAEYEQMKRIPAGRVAGYKVWKEADLKPKSLEDWEKAFEKFNKRKIK